MEMSRISIGCHRLMVGWSLRVCVCVTYATMRHTHTQCVPPDGYPVDAIQSTMIIMVEHAIQNAILQT